MSAAGAAYLTVEYVTKKRSIYDLANEKGTYPNMIRRALVRHGLGRRSKSEAQKEALKDGRHPHPTKGKARSQEERDRIRKGVKNAKQGFPFAV